MRLSATLLAAASLTPSILADEPLTQRTSVKRGLVYVPSATYPGDDAIWVTPGDDLTWYYNYQVSPSAAYSKLLQSEFEFIPMLWGLNKLSFVSEVTALIRGGLNVTHVLTFNEPDGSLDTGGSQISPANAATRWIADVEPLRQLGIKIGAPAVTGWSGGLTWLASFFASCQAQGQNCTADFFPIHYYGNFLGLADHMGQYSAAYPNATLWITEYAADHQSLNESQQFFNQSANYFDRTAAVWRYSYYGSFRSDASNVGPNAAMLTQKGALTDIGSWYLGGPSTNNIPSRAGKHSSATWLMAGVASFTIFLM